MDDEDTETETQTTQATGTPPAAAAAPAQAGRLFTQEELDAIITKRVAKLEAKANEADTLRTEMQTLRQRLDATEAAGKATRLQAAWTEAAREAGIVIDPKKAMRLADGLDFDEHGNPKGIAEAIQTLRTEAPQIFRVPEYTPPTALVTPPTQQAQATTPTAPAANGGYIPSVPPTTTAAGVTGGKIPASKIADPVWNAQNAALIAHAMANDGIDWSR